MSAPVAESSASAPPPAQEPSGAEVQIFNKWMAYGKAGFKNGNLVLTNRRISLTMKISHRIVFDVPLDDVRGIGLWATGITLSLADGSRHHVHTGIPFREKVRNQIQRAVDDY